VPQPPDGQEWLHEIKHDGYRMLAYLDDDQVILETRNKHNWTERFPDIVRELKSLKAKQAILDCELCALLPDGITSFHELQSALATKQTGPLVLFAFDLLFLNGEDLRPFPLIERKQRLKKVLGATKQKRVIYVDFIVGGGPAFFRMCCEAGLEGVVSKRADRPYSEGLSDWIKAKCNIEETLFVGGFVYGSSKRSLRELLVGRKKAQRLDYAGRVGFGFTVEAARSLLQMLEAFRQPKCPFDDKKPRDGQWVRPELHVEVRYSTQSKPGQLRHAVFRGTAKPSWDQRSLPTGTTRR